MLGTQLQIGCADVSEKVHVAKPKRAGHQPGGFGPYAPKLCERNVLSSDIAIDDVLGNFAELYDHVTDVSEPWISDECAVEVFLLCQTVIIAQHYDGLLPEEVEHPIDGGPYQQRGSYRRLSL